MYHKYYLINLKWSFLQMSLMCNTKALQVNVCHLSPFAYHSFIRSFLHTLFIFFRNPLYQGQGPSGTKVYSRNSGHKAFSLLLTVLLVIDSSWALLHHRAACLREWGINLKLNMNETQPCLFWVRVLYKQRVGGTLSRVYSSPALQDHQNFLHPSLDIYLSEKE